MRLCAVFGEHTIPKARARTICADRLLHIAPLLLRHRWANQYFCGGGRIVRANRIVHIIKTHSKKANRDNRGICSCRCGWWWWYSREHTLKSVRFSHISIRENRTVACGQAVWPSLHLEGLIS